MATKKRSSDTALFRMLSLALLVGGAMLFVRGHTRPMAPPCVISALLFLLIYGGYVRLPGRAWLCLPCLPPLVFHIVRLWNFFLAGTWRNLYTAEVMLLAVSYALAIVMFCLPRRNTSLRTVTLVLFLVCIGFGVWDIIDGWWVMMNHTWTPLGERISMFVFYYIPDTMFWIFPFLMMGHRILKQK